MKIGGTKEQELKQQQLKQEIKNVGRPVQNAKIEWSKNWLDSLSHKKKIENGANNSEDHCSLREKTRAGEKSENPRGEGGK